MAKTNILEQIKQRTSKFAYVTPVLAEELGLIFAVLTIEKGPSQFGSKWNLEIEIREDSIPDDVSLDIQPDQTTIISLPSGQSRDKTFNEIKKLGILPMHNCYIQSIPQGTGGNDFIDLKMLDDDDARYQAPTPISTRQSSSVVTATRRSNGTQMIIGSRAKRQPRQDEVNDYVPVTVDEDLP
jgi:hypothetical protein